MAKQTAFNAYSNTDFPDYEFSEYPKAIYPTAEDEANPYGPDGKPLPHVIVNSAEEEATVRGGNKVVREPDEKARLLKIAEISNPAVKLDKRWSVERMRDELVKAGADPDLDPNA